MSSFAVNSSNIDTDPISIDCDLTYDPVHELLKFGVQYAYLSIGFVVNLAILRAIWWRYRENYLSNSFFVIFSVDCCMNVMIIVTEGFIGRFMIYFSPACPFLAPYLASPWLSFKICMILIHHAKVCKSLLQSLLVLNRMTCVLMPLHHTATWHSALRFLVPFVILAPLSVDWNLAISRVYMQSTYGGFWVNYIKKVAWASQSRFQLVFLLAALFCTIFATALTLFALIRLPERIKELEKSITYASIIISCGFTTTALFQIYYSFFFTYTDASSPIYGLSILTFDFLNIGSPIVMLCVSATLRKHTFSLKKIDDDRFFTIRSRS